MKDEFRGDNANLISNIKALLELDDEKALVPHGIGGHAYKLLEAAACRLAVMPAAPSDAVLQLLNHIEDVVGDEDWERIDHKLWNAVTAQYATLKPQAEPAAGEQAGAVADDSVARLNGAVAGLQAAVIFLDQMRKAAKDGEDVTGTGAARDAREWLESAARTLLDTLSAPPAAPGAAIAAREQEAPKKTSKMHAAVRKALQHHKVLGDKLSDGVVEADLIYAVLDNLASREEAR